jgi:glycosyltransferase involved in cell wall biosynthesis
VRPLRILHLVANRWWTGSADPALDLARRLRERGHEVAFACIRGDALEAHARAAGLPLVDGVSLERTSRPWRLAAAVLAVARILRERAIDIVHAHQTHDHWIAALARGGGAPRLVRTIHHRRAVHAGPAGRWLLRRTDAVIAVSQAIAVQLAAAGVPVGRTTVVPGAVDLDRFSPRADGRPVRAELGLGEAPVVGCVARMVPGRGHDILLHAAVRLRERFPALRVVLVGRGEHASRLEALAAALGLARTVLFAGYRGEDLPSVLAAMDCAVLLGAGSEESCRAVLEAMAVGRPVVAAPVGALPETVVDGETGWLVPPEPDAVAAAIARTLADPALATRMGAAGRRRVETRFAPEGRAAAVEAIYRQALAEPGPGRR